MDHFLLPWNAYEVGSIIYITQNSAENCNAPTITQLASSRTRTFRFGQDWKRTSCPTGCSLPSQPQRRSEGAENLTARCCWHSLLLWELGRPVLTSVPEPPPSGDIISSKGGLWDVCVSGRLQAPTQTHRVIISGRGTQEPAVLTSSLHDPHAS